MHFAYLKTQIKKDYHTFQELKYILLTDKREIQRSGNECQEMIAFFAR